MLPFYSTHQVISAEGTKLLLFNGDAGHWNIYDFNGNVVLSGVAFDAAAHENADEPRWDRFDDIVIWETTGDSIEKCTITMGTPERCPALSRTHLANIFRASFSPPLGHERERLGADGGAERLERAD